MNRLPNLSILGLGYVGLPLAIALGKTFPVTGFDCDDVRVTELRRGHDRTNEFSKSTLAKANIHFTNVESDLISTDIFIVAVPTPVDDQNQPELDHLKTAAESVGRVLQKGAIVVFESTVYPGATEALCGPILEEVSGLICGVDFFLGYSPERINPGDRVHTIDKIVKIVAGQTPDVAKYLARIYGTINDNQIFVAKNIKTAEAAKVIENAQRDINIAFMNEIAQIFHPLDLSIFDVLDAAKTKWNFLPFSPGLVGGHCIGVDPYYLAHSAKKVGIDPKMVLSGRATNNGMASYVAKQISDQLASKSRILVLGLTFKEDVPDLRNSKVSDIVTMLSNLGHIVKVHDPLADPEEAFLLYKINLVEEFMQNFDCVLGCVMHREYFAFDFSKVLRTDGLIADLKGIWRTNIDQTIYRYWTL